MKSFLAGIFAGVIFLVVCFSGPEELKAYPLAPLSFALKKAMSPPLQHGQFDPCPG